MDVDGNMQFNPRELTPEARYVPPTRALPYHRQRSAIALIPTAVAPRRNPLNVLDTNIIVLRKEISRLEQQNKALREHMATQEILINGFCKLYVANGPG